MPREWACGMPMDAAGDGMLDAEGEGADAAVVVELNCAMCSDGMISWTAVVLVAMSLGRASWRSRRYCTHDADHDVE